MALERLSPLERAAFLLHDVFGVPLGEVADALDREAAGRAPTRRPGTAERGGCASALPVEREEGERIARAFFAASTSGDTAALRTLLAENAVLRSDGGGKVFGLHQPHHWIGPPPAHVRGCAAQMGTRLGADARTRLDRRLAGYISRERGDVLQTTALAIEDGRITAIYITRNPDKLRHVAQALA